MNADLKWRILKIIEAIASKVRSEYDRSFVRRRFEKLFEDFEELEVYDNPGAGLRFYSIDAHFTDNLSL